MQLVWLFIVCLLSVGETQTGLNPSLAVDSGSAGGFWSSINTSYNTQTNLILANWVTPEGLYDRLFNSNGTPYSSPILLLSSDDISIASSTISSCYNAQDNQFLITFLAAAESGYGIYFFIVNYAGVIVLGPTEAIHLDNNSFVAPGCCYNNTTNQYGITINNGDEQILFAILNADGTVSSTTTIPGSTVASDTYTSSIVYNSTNNQYLISWQNPTPAINFAVYNADGTIDAGIGLATVPFVTDPMDDPYSILVPTFYNSHNNQYLIAWVTGSGSAYFSIYDADGNQLVEATSFTTDSLDPAQNMVIAGAFNATNATYFLSWMGIDSSYHYSIINGDGSIAVLEQPVANYLATGANPGGRGTATYMPVLGGSMYISWVNQYNTPTVNGFSAVYSGAPLGPLSTSTTVLNRFANYGDFFNQLSWWSPVNSSVVSYQIYRSTTLLATLSGIQTTYQDYNQSPSGQALYKVIGYGAANSPLMLTYIQTQSVYV